MIFGYLWKCYDFQDFQKFVSVLYKFRRVLIRFQAGLTRSLRSQSSMFETLGNQALFFWEFLWSRSSLALWLSGSLASLNWEWCRDKSYFTPSRVLFPLNLPPTKSIPFLRFRDTTVTYQKILLL